jgi:hypothetical protein
MNTIKYFIKKAKDLSLRGRCFLGQREFEEKKGGGELFFSFLLSG